jgi:integrase/recombinase XerD
MTYIPVDVEAAVRRECKRRRYSERTAKTYVFCINRFLKWSNKDIGKVSKKDVRMFLEHLSSDKTGSTMNVYHMAIRFLFQDVLDKKMWINIHYSKIPEALPTVLTKKEVLLLLNNITNPKHKLMTGFLYSSGLRVSELLNMKVKDIYIDENYGFVRRGKGNKDRIFILSEKLKDGLKALVEENLNKEDYLFSSNRGRKYSPRSIQEIIKKAAKTAGIKKHVHPHTLRHSFATHLIENNYSVSEVQSLLGHKSPETTFIYLHTASPNMIKVKSPLDGM